jgi:hypothetical protein
VDFKGLKRGCVKEGTDFIDSHCVWIELR